MCMIVISCWAQISNSSRRSQAKRKFPSTIRLCQFSKPSSAVLCCFKVSFTTKGKKKEKSSNRLTAAILKDFRLENMECCKYQLIFVTAEEVLSKPILFCLKIKKTVSPFHSSALCVFVFVG